MFNSTLCIHDCFFKIQEDKKLLELVKEHGYNRKKISENMNKRSYTDSLWRYNFHLNPNIRKGKWTPNVILFLLIDFPFNF